jgi:apolipoprotein D and lipocalin family protein
MKPFNLSLVVVLVLFELPFAVPASGVDPVKAGDPIPVSRVDLNRYTGTWYELAKIPNRFQKKCAGRTTAHYTLKEDGKIQVVNRCRKANGEYDEARGIARIVDPQTRSRLEVSFVSFLGFRPFWGDYWILGLGEDYEYAVVGSPDRKYGWILARSPNADPEILEAAWETLRNQGFDPEEFEATLHASP